MGSVQVVRGGELSTGLATEGVARRAAEVDEHVSLGEIRSAPQTMSGWHHHGEHTTCVYVAQGPLRIEWGPGGRESIELADGDFYVISPNTIHREGNPGSGEQQIVGFYVGSGANVVNVDGPEPAE